MRSKPIPVLLFAFLLAGSASAGLADSGGFPKACAGTYLTQEGSGAQSIWTLGADGSFLGESSTQEAFNFSGQQGTWESSGSADAKGVLLDFSFDSGGALLNIARVDIVLHRVGHDCAE